jgi:uncharacterized membrane protein
MVREGNDETIWARLHARQALVLGLVASLIFVLILAVPLVVVIAVPAISIGTTIGVYAAGLAIDVCVALGFVLMGLRYSARAARGELFSIPVVTPIVDRFFRLKRP